MKEYSKLSCEACDSNSSPLSPVEIESLMVSFTEWQLVEVDGIQQIQATFKTQNFENSVAFTNLLAQVSDHENHHPRIILEYSSVTVEWWSHSIKGLHKNDFIMAAKTEDIYQTKIAGN